MKRLLAASKVSVMSAASGSPVVDVTSPELIEAADMGGATRRQVLWHVRLPMALPTMLVGANQSVMFSLFMVIIAAFIGTQDLGQEMQRALSSTDVGKGLVLGFAAVPEVEIAEALMKLRKAWRR